MLHFLFLCGWVGDNGRFGLLSKDEWATRLRGEWVVNNLDNTLYTNVGILLGLDLNPIARSYRFP